MMDTRLSEDDLAFQVEVRQFLTEAWDKELAATYGDVWMVRDCAWVRIKVR